MNKVRLPIWSTEEYRYPLSYGFLPTLTGYLHQDGEERPCIIVVPGGGYEYLSPGEAEMVALEFYSRGYQTYVCVYTTNLAVPVPLGLQPLKDLSRAVRLIRERAGKDGINPDRIILCGFSAGAHLCGSLCVHHRDVRDENAALNLISNAPSAAILAYPVITGFDYSRQEPGKGYWHHQCFVRLLGERPTQEETDYFSLEKHVDSQTPPCFLWHTARDSIVPVENSFLFAQACLRKDVPCALHIFSAGDHGLSLANRLWARGEYGSDYVLEQSKRIAREVKAGRLERPGRDAGEIERFCQGKRIPKPQKPVCEAARWPQMADEWLRQMLGETAGRSPSAF